MKQVLEVVVCCSAFAVAACGSDDGGGDDGNGGGTGGTSSETGECVSGTMSGFETENCEGVLADFIAAYAELESPIVVVAASWGEIPASMQLLPAGAEMCGVYYNADDAGNPVRVSWAPVTVIVRASGCMDAVLDFYAEAFTGLGCESQDRPLDEIRAWSCPNEPVDNVSVAPEVGYSGYIIQSLLP